ncbi:MAG: phosphoribosylamine--glycine ligase [Elusimicrobiota bacterium]|nr:MAG: phosphoribosylamine--glycine ligase [Elusimicrobiota bacterium]
MKVLLLGSGGREHAMAWALAKSPRLTKLWAAPGSDGMASLAERVPLDPLDGAAVARFCREKEVELLVVGPEAPLAAGVADAARAAGIPVFGPGRDGARLESSKAFAKAFMARHGLPTAKARVGGTAEALAAVRELKGRCAVKADGLAAGKGVVVSSTLAEAEAAVAALGGTAAGATLVVEELLTGPEISMMAVLDGKSYALLPASQDHKRLLDGDKGPNTGGMGALCPAPLDAKTLATIRAEVFDRALKGLAADGVDFRGVLYAGLMLTPEGPKLLEFNARLGDPETQAILPLLDADFLELCLACATGTLKARDVPAKPGACVSVVVAAEGYPDSPRAGAALTPEAASGLDVVVFHAGTRREGGRWLAAGGRVLSVVGLGPDLASARERAYAAVPRVAGPGLQWRTDVAAKVLGRTLA